MILHTTGCIRLFLQISDRRVLEEYPLVLSQWLI